MIDLSVDDWSDEEWAIAQKLLDQILPRFIRDVFERSTDKSLPPAKRLDNMRALVHRPNVTRRHLTPEQIRVFGASVEAMTTDRAASMSQQRQARRVLTRCNKYGLCGAH